MKRALVIAVVLLGGCGKKDKDSDKDKGGGTAAGTASTEPPAEKASAEELFPNGKVGMPAPAAKLVLDMPEAEAKAAAPEVFAYQYGEVPGYHRLKINTQIEDGRLYEVRVEFGEKHENVKAYLDKKWGAPRVIKDSTGTEEYYYDNPADGIRAKLDRSHFLRYSQVMSRDQLFGTDPKLWGFEKAPLIGQSQADIENQFARYHPKPRKEDASSLYIGFPPLTTSQYPSSVDVKIKDGKAVGFSLNISTGGDTSTDEALAARLEQLYGKGKPDAYKMYTNYPGPPKAKAELRKDSASFGHSVWVGTTR